MLQQYKTNNDTDPLNKLPQYNQISDLHIDEDGVASLLKFVKNINSSKAPGPDQIPNHNYTYFFKECATELAPGLNIQNIAKFRMLTTGLDKC